MSTVNTRRPRVLLAEDDADLRWGMTQVLWDLGCDVLEAPDGAAFLDAITTAVFDGRMAPPDMIITDIRMPGINGLSVIEGLRDLGWGIPVLVMSAFGDHDTRERVHRLHDADFLDKPIDLNRLEDSLRRLVLSPT